MQQNPHARAAHFEVADLPIAGVGEQNADIADLLIAQNLRARSRSVSIQRNRLSRRTVAGELKFLVPGAAPRQQNLIARQKSPYLVCGRKAAPRMSQAVLSAIAAV